MFSSACRLSRSNIHNGCQRHFSLASQIQLETMPIVCKISRAACSKLAELRKERADDMHIALGVDSISDRTFNSLDGEGIQLVLISKYFLAGRLPFLNAEEGHPQETSEPVAPSFRTVNSFRLQYYNSNLEKQIERLRKMTFLENPISQLKYERWVNVLSLLDPEDYKYLKRKSLKDLKAQLILGSETYHALNLEPVDSSGNKRLEYSIDFKNRWELTSQLFE